MRNYGLKGEGKYHSTEEQKKRRASRNKARNSMKRKGLVRKGDGKDVHHVSGNPMNNSSLRAVPQSTNRSFARTQGGHKRYRTA